MEWQWQEGLLTVELQGPFDLAQTLTCGQCFRWRAEGEGFSGVVQGRAVTARQAGGRLTLSGLAQQQIPWFLHYFALDEDYAALQRQMGRSAPLAACIAAAPGIRVLHQEYFEVLLTFILSQNNNIPRIAAIVDRLCTAFGRPLPGGGFAFPLPEALAGRSEAELGCLRAGWRAAYLLDAAEKVAGGALAQAALDPLPTPQARALLQTIRGVGPKVADCVLLYGLGRAEACPMDVWMKRAMARLFPDGLPPCAAPCAGIAQQYIFCAERTRPPQPTAARGR